VDGNKGKLPTPERPVFRGVVGGVVISDWANRCKAKCDDVGQAGGAKGTCSKLGKKRADGEHGTKLAILCSREESFSTNGDEHNDGVVTHVPAGLDAAVVLWSSNDCVTRFFAGGLRKQCAPNVWEGLFFDGVVKQ
jgi:hypothetical protein